MTGTGGGLRGSAAWVQTPLGLEFVHQLTGDTRAWERITEVPALTIPRPGEWRVDYQARGSVIVPSGTAGSQYVAASIYVNGSRVAGSEAIAAGTSSLSSEASADQSTGGVCFVHLFEAGDVVELWANRIGQAGTAQVLSNADGRTSVMAVWLAPAGSMP